MTVDTAEKADVSVAPVAEPDTKLSAGEQDALLQTSAAAEKVAEVPPAQGESTSESRSWSNEGEVD